MNDPAKPKPATSHASACWADDIQIAIQKVQSMRAGICRRVADDTLLDMDDELSMAETRLLRALEIATAPPNAEITRRP